jgi:ATP-dependent Clp protease adaptor protein ClpS
VRTGAVHHIKTGLPRCKKVFVVTVLKAEFRMSNDHAYRIMMTAHRRGVCVVAVFAKDIAETKATRATEVGRSKGYPLTFTTEPEE